MAKTVNDIVEGYCKKGLPPAKIFRLMKQFVSRGGVYKAVKRFRETGSCAPRIRSTPEKPIRTKELIKKVRERLRRNPSRSARKLAKGTSVSVSTMQRLLKDDLHVYPYKFTKRQLLSNATKKKRLDRAKVLIKRLVVGMWPQVLWTDEKLFTVQAIHNHQNDRIWIPNKDMVPVERCSSFRRQKPSFVWRGLTCKLLRLLPDKHMVKMIMELVRNRSFTLTTGDSKQSRLRRLKNGVPQGSVLAPLLFNIYTYDLPSMISRKFAYADDLALLHSSGHWKDLEGTLSQGMSTLSAYLQTWRLKLSHTKTVTTAFHLNNQEAKRELKVYNNSRLLPFCPTPTYLGVKLDRSLTFRHHLVALRKKLSSCVTLLRRLVGSGWGAGAKTLRIATLSLVYSTAEYCAPVWCRSAHTRLIDRALRIVTGCLRPTPTDHLPVLSGIQPAELRRLGATLSLAYRGSLDPNHILHGLLSGSSDTGQVRLRSRRPFVPGARNLLDNLARLGIRASEWMNHKWNAEYCENASRLRAFVPGTSVRPVGMGLPRAAWVKLNRLRTGVGRFHSSMHKWGLAPSPNCECGASEQTADHVLTMCPIHRAPHGARGLTVLDDETRCWLNNITASI